MVVATSSNSAQTPESAQIEQVWQWLEDVPDPEIPVVSVLDLGMIRDVQISANTVAVHVAPTYSGCPATEVIEDSIVSYLRDKGVKNITIKRVLSPAWTTDWITTSGREKLLAYGIVPPVHDSSKRLLLGKTVVKCPQCCSSLTSLVSEFGSTACKAAYKCEQCFEPFEYFKCI
ncbi:MAG: phenylacetate-CoA oxygenase subunit PaaJ [Woeseia sp.]|jgi:ring-1,2-phenylacetyl-CoA epoxidase subunit PaaD|nr:phenylacetate-CoA oxygenase subunit PaaJ [Woeseia sp.]MBT6209967.1 phenylacetate-CoA oxygenase subunit PaaJ [Woeseia sp.]